MRHFLRILFTLIEHANLQQRMSILMFKSVISVIIFAALSFEEACATAIALADAVSGGE